jgi:hypothetical protein
LDFQRNCLAPILGQNFIVTHNWNFLTELGFGFFTDRQFVLWSGKMEVVFGSVSILGTSRRLKMLTISRLMALSNVVSIIQEQKTDSLVEFVGRMPFIPKAFVLLLLAYGQWLIIAKLLTLSLISQKT